MIMRRKKYLSDEETQTINKLFNSRQVQTTHEAISFRYCEDVFDKQINLAGEVSETKDLTLVSKL